MKLGDSSHDFLFESSIFREIQSKFTSILENTNLQIGMVFISLINLGRKLIHYKPARQHGFGKYVIIFHNYEIL